jgi:hypothetical protein
MFGKKADKILKNVNALDLIPVAKHRHEIRENNRVALLIPKFKNEEFARWFIPRRKSIYFSVKLDEAGSMVYQLIDGKRNIQSICSIIIGNHSNNIENLEERTVTFITQMYKYRFITFDQLRESEDH